jgi:carbon-monoxide dehydrogenase medium subunit
VIARHFAYETPRDLGAATAILAAGGAGVAVLGGGTWLVPNMSLGASAPDVVLDTRHLGLQSIEESPDELLIGARVTYEQIKASALVRRHAPLLALMANKITGGLQITGQGTLGGSACYANPSSDVPACLAVLGARLQLASSMGQRDVPAAEFFTAAFVTARRADELLTSIVIPKCASPRAGYYKLKFSTGSWPIVTAACLPLSDGEKPGLRIGIGGACVTPVVFSVDMAAQEAASVEASVAAAATQSIVDEWSDEFAGPGYRRAVAGAIAVRALRACQGAAR